MSVKSLIRKNSRFEEVALPLKEGMAPSNGHVLTYVTANSQWENVAPGAGGGQTLYDIVITRSDYASDALAGEALKTALETNGNKTIYITAGTYDIGNNNIHVADSFVRIIGEHSFYTGYHSGSQSNSVVIISSKNSGNIFDLTPANSLDASTTKYIENIQVYFSATSTSARYGFVNAGTYATKQIWKNCSVENYNTTYDTGFLGNSATTWLSWCLRCSVKSGQYGFKYITGGLQDCFVNTIGTSAYYYCNRLVNCVAQDYVSTIDNYIFNHCEVLINCKFVNHTITSGRNTKYMFYFCTDLVNCKGEASEGGGSTKFTSNHATKSYNGATGAFFGCDRLSNCYVSGEITNNYRYGSGPEYEYTESASYDYCTNLSNCVSEATIQDYMENYGSVNGNCHFFMCKNVSNCKAKLIHKTNYYAQTGFGGFSVGLLADSYNLSNCQVIFNHGNVALDVPIGFDYCEQLSNCEVRVISTDFWTENHGYGFNHCNGVSNCKVLGAGTVNTRFAKGFYDCKDVVNCYCENVATCYDTCKGNLNSYGAGVTIADTGCTQKTAFNTSVPRA